MDDFTRRLDKAARKPVVREPDCACGTRLGDWTEGCPVHPMDDDDAVWAEAVRDVLSEHDAHCLLNAMTYAVSLGHDTPSVVEQICAQSLAEGEVACACRA